MAPFLHLPGCLLPHKCANSCGQLLILCVVLFFFFFQQTSSDDERVLIWEMTPMNRNASTSSAPAATSSDG